MDVVDRFIRTSPTDLANFLACRHKTSLDLAAALGQLAKPQWVDPLAEVLRQRGAEHERSYVSALRADGLTIVDLGEAPWDARHERTLTAMRLGADVIVQAGLKSHQWIGYADVLRKVSVPSPTFGGWSYEALDTKLSRETRGGTILQLCVYTDLVGDLQGRPPEYFHVVTPAAVERYRFDDFAAFYRQVRASFVEFVERHRCGQTIETYPEPVDHCAVCRWWS